MAEKFADRIGRLENVLNECIERLLDERNAIQINALCLLIKAYTNQKGSNVLLFHQFSNAFIGISSLLQHQNKLASLTNW